jgi:hypothetical protein
MRAIAAAMLLTLCACEETDNSPWLSATITSVGACDADGYCAINYDFNQIYCNVDLRTKNARWSAFVNGEIMSQRANIIRYPIVGKTFCVYGGPK